MDIKDPETLAEVRVQFVRYEMAIAVLDELFRSSPHTPRFGAGENLHGYQAIAVDCPATRRMVSRQVSSFTGRDGSHRCKAS